MQEKVIDALISNILETRFETLDKTVVEHAKDLTIDVVGCAIAGANSPGCSMVMDLVKEWGGKGESTVFAYGFKAPSHNVAMMNSVMARSVDFEPLSPYINGRSVPGHICGTTIPTAITVAEQRSASGKDLITAIALGNDIAARILASSHLSFQNGWMSSGLCNAFGATAIASKLWGLNERQTLNAFGIMVNQLGGTIQCVYDGVHSFKLLQGLTSKTGIFSVELAAKGFTGVKDPLQSKFGYFSLYCRDYDLEALTKDLGKEFYADSTFKPYPCCRGNHAPIECILQIVMKHDIAVNNIENVRVDVSPVWLQFIGGPFEPGDIPQIRAIYSLPYNIANAIIRKSVTPVHFTDEYIKDAQVMDLMKKVTINAVPVPPIRPMMTDVRLKMTDGTEYSAHVDVPRGEPVLNPLTSSEIRDKFRSNVAYSMMITPEKTEKALAMLERLEEVENVTQLIRLLVK